MIYDFIYASGHSDKFTKEMIDCIYAGVVADTGSFRFSSTTAAVHKLVADLKKEDLNTCMCMMIFLIIFWRTGCGLSGMYC